LLLVAVVVAVMVAVVVVLVVIYPDQLFSLSELFITLLLVAVAQEQLLKLVLAEAIQLV
jgi:hypothetical protein